MKISVIIASIFMLSGCGSLTLPVSKTIVIAPSTSPTVVKADSVTTCKEGFMTWHCNATLELKKVVEVQ